MEEGSCRDWAREYFGGLELGDARLTARAVEMACTAAGRPGGRVLDVYQTSASRQGAYDFLENAAAKGAAMVDGIGLATASGSQGHSHVLVSVDGSSLNIVDRGKSKGFGIVGNANKNARGLKVVTSYALQPDGTPLGVLDQQWWLRGASKKDRAWRHRTTAQKETRYFNEALEQCARRLKERAPETRAWFLLDRDSDRRATLDLARGMTQHWFTIRVRRALDAVLQRSYDEAELREKIRARYAPHGDAALTEIALVLSAARAFPVTKNGCSRLRRAVSNAASTSRSARHTADSVASAAVNRP